MSTQSAAVKTHNCDYGIDDSASYHNFAHLITDQFDKSRGLLELYNKFTPEEKAAVATGLKHAESKYNDIKQTLLDFICFFDHQDKQPVDLYDNAHDSLKMCSNRLSNIATAKLMLTQWDYGLTYDWANADRIIAETRFLKASKPLKQSR